MLSAPPSSSLNQSQNVMPLILLGLSMIVFSGFAVSLMSQPFELDEACSILKAGLSFDELVKYLKNDGHTPLYYLILKMWLWGVGGSELSARSFSLLCQLGASVMLYVHGRVVLRSSWAGAFSGSVFLMGVVAMETAMIVKMYSMMALLTVLAIIFSQLFIHTGKKHYLGLLALTICVASFTNSMIFFVIIGLLGATVIQGRACWFYLAVSCLAGLLPYALGWLPIAMGQAQNASIDWIRQSTIIDPLIDIYRLFGRSTFGLLILCLLTVDSSGINIFQKASNFWRAIMGSLNDRRVLFPFVLYLVSFGAFCATSFLVKPLLGISRYGIIFLPMVAIVIGAFMARLEHRKIAAALLLSLLIFNLIPHDNVHYQIRFLNFVPAYNNRYNTISWQNSKILIETLSSRLQQGDMIVSVGQSYLMVKMYLEKQKVPQHRHIAIPRDVEVTPGWNRYNSLRNPPEDMQNQWDGLYSIIQQDQPGQVFVISSSNVAPWFVNRFFERMNLIEEVHIHRGWCATKLHIFAMAKSDSKPTLLGQSGTF